jgi:hypothetical protein
MIMNTMRVTRQRFTEKNICNAIELKEGLVIENAFLMNFHVSCVFHTTWTTGVEASSVIPGVFDATIRGWISEAVPRALDERM